MRYVSSLRKILSSMRARSASARKNYTVTLGGLVSNEAVKEAAEFDAWYVFGVDKVTNNLEVENE